MNWIYAATFFFSGLSIGTTTTPLIFKAYH
jgi:hypothetical protein